MLRFVPTKICYGAFGRMIQDFSMNVSARTFKIIVGEDGRFGHKCNGTWGLVRIAVYLAWGKEGFTLSKGIVFTNEEDFLRRSVTFVSDLKRKPLAREFLARLVPGLKKKDLKVLGSCLERFFRMWGVHRFLRLGTWLIRSFRLIGVIK